MKNKYIIYFKGGIQCKFHFVVLQYVHMDIWHVSQPTNAWKKQLTRLVVVLRCQTWYAWVRWTGVSTEKYVPHEPCPCREFRYSVLLSSITPPAGRRRFISPAGLRRFVSPTILFTKLLQSARFWCHGEGRGEGGGGGGSWLTSI